MREFSISLSSVACLLAQRQEISLINYLSFDEFEESDFVTGSDVARVKKNDLWSDKISSVIKFIFLNENFFLQQLNFLMAD
jgi:hypothetical protein